MGIFEEIELADFARAIRAVDGVARAISNPDATRQLRELIDQAADATAASEAATRLAREERETADAKLKELATAGDNHADWLRRTEAEWRQRDQDQRESAGTLDQREHIVGERERAAAEEWRKIDAAKAAMRAHIGEAA
jgi:hypothetical protein